MIERWAQSELRRRTPKPAGGDNQFSSQPRQRRCQEMFAELSNYLDDEMDDPLCTSV
jgi:hypothetical protein